MICEGRFDYNQKISKGEQIFLTFGMALESSLGEKLAKNLFPIVDFNEGKIMTINPFSLYLPEDFDKSKDNYESCWNFYDSSSRNIQNEENEDYKIDSLNENYLFRKNQEKELTKQMIGKLKENFPPQTFFQTNFVKKNFIFLPGSQKKTECEDLLLIESDYNIIIKKSFYLDDFVVLKNQFMNFNLNLNKSDLEKEKKTISENNSLFSFENPFFIEKINDSNFKTFFNIFPLYFQKLFAKKLGNYNRLWNSHPVEIFKEVSRAILIKDLSQLNSTSIQELSFFSEKEINDTKYKDHIKKYTSLLNNPRFFLDQYFLLKEKLKINKNDEFLLNEIVVVDKLKEALEDMNIGSNLIHFMKTQLENKNCLIILGSPEEIYYVKEIKGSIKQIEDIYIIIENSSKKEFIFSFDLPKYHYAYFVFLHSSLTLEDNPVYSDRFNYSTQN